MKKAKCIKCGNKFNIHPWMKGKELIMCMTDKIIDDMLEMTFDVLSYETRQKRKIKMEWHYE
jgi:hypothetical protein